MSYEPLRAAARHLLPGAAWRLRGALALCTLTSACAVTPLTAPPAPAPAVASTPAAPAEASTPAPAASTPDAATPAPKAATPSLVVTNIDSVGTQEATATVLRYADRVRTLTPAELGLEIAALGEPGSQPLRQMQLAVALMHSNQPVETARALGLLQRVAANTSTDATPYRPLARLIAQRLMEQRKLEEALDRQAQQLREQQRRIEQLNERLEAMRAIERSLNNRAPARPAAP
ncbi:hypothetical protein [Hydrogenophaga intermedia]|uniref:hypothetical protein n=1 Tax=Hydrogenophaga intermedia TaxID=65786 RepID=UPI0020433427|nr:hypothetical protein [Hydrogenophaga intermedia]MCM3562535.1 hypothetical protein [Hydrogenophaga intermedia]